MAVVLPDCCLKSYVGFPFVLVFDSYASTVLVIGKSLIIHQMYVKITTL